MLMFSKRYQSNNINSAQIICIENWLLNLIDGDPCYLKPSIGITHSTILAFCYNKLALINPSYTQQYGYLDTMRDTDKLIGIAMHLYVYNEVLNQKENNKSEIENDASFFKSNTLCQYALQSNNPYILQDYVVSIGNQLNTIKLMLQRKLRPHQNEINQCGELVSSLLELTDKIAPLVESCPSYYHMLLALAYYFISDSFLINNQDGGFDDVDCATDFLTQSYYNLLKSEHFFDENSDAIQVLTCGEGLFNSVPVKSFSGLKRHIYQLQLIPVSELVRTIDLVREEVRSISIHAMMI